MRRFGRSLEDRNSWSRRSSWIVQKGRWKESTVASGCSSLRVFLCWYCSWLSISGLFQFETFPICYRLHQAFRMFWQALFCRVPLDEFGALFAMPWHNWGQRETVKFFADVSKAFTGQFSTKLICRGWMPKPAEDFMELRDVMQNSGFRRSVQVWRMIDCCFACCG